MPFPSKLIASSERCRQTEVLASPFVEVFPFKRSTIWDSALLSCRLGLGAAEEDLFGLTGVKNHIFPLDFLGFAPISLLDRIEECLAGLLATCSAGGSDEATGEAFEAAITGCS